MSLDDQINAGPMSIQHKGNVDENENDGKMNFDQTISGTFQADANGVRKLEPVEYNSFSNDSGHEQAVLSTLRNSAGTPTGDFTNIDESRYSVEVDGVRTSLSVAIRLGYVVKDADGYRDGTPGETYTPADIQPEQNMSAPVHESVQELRAVIGENNANAMLHSVIGAVINSETDDDKAFGDFGSQLGLELEEGADVAKAITADLGSALVTKTAAKFNLDHEELTAFLYTCAPQLQTQLILRVLHGEPSVFHDLASRWKFGNIR